MTSKKRSPLVAIVLAVVIGLLVIALLNGVIRPTQVVVARVPIAAGTILSDQLVELRTIPMGAKPADAFAKIEDVKGKMVTVSRTPGDTIVKAVLGEVANSGIPAELEDGHVAMAIKVDLASGVAGLVRPGQTVSVIGMISPDLIRDNSASVITGSIPELATPIVTSTGSAPYQIPPVPTPTSTPAAPQSPLARLAITGLKVLMVPQSFRYEELPTGSSQEELFSAAQTTASAQEGSVIVLDVPTALVEVTPGFKVDPATLLSALDQYGTIHLALEPAKGLDLDVSDVVTLNLGDLYQQMNEHLKK